jgi:putative ATP-dependent endonuclease of OLD family
MYLSKITIENFRCFGEGEKHFELDLKPGLTALVGENDSGKSAVIDALRFILGTTDNDWPRIEDADFYREETSRHINIVCKFEGLNNTDRRAFVEYLTYNDNKEDMVLFVNWTAKGIGLARRGRFYPRVEIHSGKEGNGPKFATEVRELLRATYLKPLRDAEQVLSAGRTSHLSQILLYTDQIKNVGFGYNPGADVPIDQETLDNLNVLGIGDLTNALLKKQQGIISTQKEINKYLEKLSLSDDAIESNINVSGETASEDIRLRRLLEKFNLILNGMGKQGLGSNNLLFMACEFLLLARENEGSKLLLIEEPEAHLHAQRQLRVMDFLQEQAKEKQAQIIVTTHSPNLASSFKLDNIVILQNFRAFSLSMKNTELEPSDYRFLERFLDVTKANLFFARGVLIVEGDAENILLPTLANLIGRDFTEHGVSIVNVGGVGLRRYAKIFQRKNVKEDNKEGQIDVPVACVTDMDVMPDCAPVIIGEIKENDEWPNNRRWKAKRDIDNLAAYRTEKEAKASGQNVRTFVSDEWTLEYDLAFGTKDEDGKFHDLAEDVYVAAFLAENDDAINGGKKKVTDVEKAALKNFADLKEKALPIDNCSPQEVLASHVYAKYCKSGVSKPVAAQYLAERLQEKHEKDELTLQELRKKLPKYLTDAIDYVTRHNYAIEE